jgi:hypothetical protein
MRTSTQWLLSMGLIGVLTGVVARAQTTNPHVGLWKANVATSKINVGPALKSGTTKIEPAGAGVKYTVDIAFVDGTARHWEFIANYDGKDYPVTGDSPFGDVVALTQVDARTVRTVNKKGAKVLSTQTAVLSNDGKIRTVTTKGPNALGETVDANTIYERQ